MVAEEVVVAAAVENGVEEETKMSSFLLPLVGFDLDFLTLGKMLEPRIFLLFIFVS